MITQEEKAIKFTIKAFEGLKRKKENIDMSYHSITVGFMLKNMNMSEEIVIIGLLHDVIEDTCATYDEIEKEFGKSIADNVMMLSEDKSIKDYKERKTNFIKKISELNKDILCVELADKLQNLTSDYNNFLVKGKDI